MTVLNEPGAVAAVLDVVRQAPRDGVIEEPQYTDVQAALRAPEDQMGTRA